MIEFTLVNCGVLLLCCRLARSAVMFVGPTLIATNMMPGCRQTEWGATKTFVAVFAELHVPRNGQMLFSSPPGCVVRST